MSSREFSDWQVYQIVEPLHQDRTDFMLAQLCAIVMSALGGKKRYAPKDFMPWASGGSRGDGKVRGKAMAGWFKMFTKTLGSKVPGDK